MLLSSSGTKYEDFTHQMVEKEIQGEIKKSFALYKEKKEGGIDYKAFFIVNEENAHKARIRAMQMAMEESEFARENAERISKYVNEAFTVEQK